MKLSFNPLKPHGTVTPPYNGAVWHQVASDGKPYYFNGAGEPIDVETGEALVIEVEKPEPKIVKSRVVNVDKDGNKTVIEVEKAQEEPKDPREELMKWLRGTEGAEKNWMIIRSYGKDVFGKIAASKDELISLAIDGNMIPADQIRA